jgi:hypothetical protein
MIPKLLEYEDGRIKVTAEAYTIPEVHALIIKYDMKAEPYLSYVYGMTAPDSIYMNVPIEGDERSDSIIYDIKQTLGEFDHEEPLLQNAVDRLLSIYMTPNMALANELGEELHRMRKWLKNNPITEQNLPLRQSIMKDIDKYSLNYTKVKQNAEKEMEVATKGDHEMGDY